MAAYGFFSDAGHIEAVIETTEADALSILSECPDGYYFEEVGE